MENIRTRYTSAGIQMHGHMYKTYIVLVVQRFIMKEIFGVYFSRTIIKNNIQKGREAMLRVLNVCVCVYGSPEPNYLLYGRT